MSMDTNLEISADGWMLAAHRINSPNFDERPFGEIISMLVIHAISLPPSVFGGDDVPRLFTNVLDPAGHPYFSQVCSLRVSAHFFIRRDGALMQFVSCLHRAWHAGVSAWRERDRCNDFSIGIELEGCDELSFEEPQYVCLINLITTLRGSYPITTVVGHSDISPGRKTDPGPFFDWKRLAGEGVSLVRAC